MGGAICLWSHDPAVKGHVNWPHADVAEQNYSYNQSGVASKDSSKLPGTLLKKLVLPSPVRMPLERSRFEQLPLPSLHWYAGFSGLALFYVLVYAIMSPDGPARTLESEIWCTAVSGSTDARSVKLPTPLCQP